MSKEQFIEERVTKIVARTLNVTTDKVVLTASFSGDLGADSMDFIELIMALEDEFAAEIQGEIAEMDAEKLRTVGQVVDYIRAKVRASEVRPK